MSGQNAPHPSSIAESELARLSGIARCQLRQEWRGCSFCSNHERILCGITPGDRRQADTGADRAPEIGEGDLWVVEEHDTKARDDRIKARSEEHTSELQSLMR